MGKRWPSPTRVKRHRSYEIVEAARALDVHKNTVCRWIKDQGLEAITDRKPFLIRGTALQDFLRGKRTGGRSKCELDQLYCLKCRAPREPAGRFVLYRAVTEAGGNLEALCAVCETRMFKGLSSSDLPALRLLVDVLLPEAERDIGDTAVPSLNGDFDKES